MNLGLSSSTYFRQIPSSTAAHRTFSALSFTSTTTPLPLRHRSPTSPPPALYPSLTL